MARDVVVKLNLDSKTAEKSIEDLTKELADMNEELNGLAIGSEEFDDLSKEIKKTETQLSSLNNEIGVVDGSINDLTNKVGRLEDELKNTEVGSDAFKSLTKDLKKAKGELSDAENDAKSLGEQFKAMPGIVGVVSQSVGGLGQSFKALAANPVVAIISLVALIFTAVIDRMKETREGTAKLNKIFAALGAVIDPILDLLGTLVGILIDFVSFIIDNVIGAVSSLISLFSDNEDAIKDNSKSIAELTEEYTKLEDAKKKLEVTTAKEKAAIEELKTIRDDENKSIEERFKANDEIAKRERELAAERVKLGKAEIDNLQARVDKEEAAGNVSTELLDQLRDAQKEYYDTIAEQEGIRVEAVTNRNNLIKDEISNLDSVAQKEIEVANARGASESQLYKLKRDNISEQLKVLEKRNATELQEYKDLQGELKILDAERTKELAEEQKKRLALISKTNDEIEDLLANRIKDDEDREKAILNLTKERLEEELKLNKKLTNEQRKLIKLQIEDVENSISEIEKLEEKQVQDKLKNNELLLAQEKITQAEIAQIKVESAKQEELLNATSQKQREAIIESYKNKEVQAQLDIINAKGDLLNVEREQELDSLKEGSAEYLAAVAEFDKSEIELNQEKNDIINQQEADATKKREEEQKKREEDRKKEIQNTLDDYRAFQFEFTGILEGFNAPLNKLKDDLVALFDPENEDSFINKLKKGFSPEALGDAIGFGLDTINGLLTAFTSNIDNELNERLNAIGEASELRQEQLAEDFEKTNERTERIKEIYGEESDEFKRALDDQTQAQAEFNEKQAAEEVKRARLEREAKKKAFEEEKKFNLANAIIGVASGIATSLPNFILAGLVAAAGAVQIATISQQKPNFANGGLVTGSGSGRSDSIPANLSNGEFVINAQATESFLPLLESINSNSSLPSLSTLPQNQRDMRVTVVETDITSTQNNVTRIEENSVL